jgi:hypothetical protein
MSIGICDLNMSKACVLGFALLCSVALSACDGADGAGFSFAPKTATPQTSTQTGPVIPKTTRTTLARGLVNLKAPKGYCIDTTSISNGLQGSSAMLAKCSSLDGKGAGADAAVMSVSISPRRGDAAATPSANDLAQAATPRNILQLKQKGNLALVQIGTGGTDVFSAADQVHWRGATSLDTRLVLLGLFAPEGSTLTADKGGELLTSLARGISATRGSLLGLGKAPVDAQPVLDGQTQPEAARRISTPDTVEVEKKGASGFIGRLLNRS